MDLTKIDVPFGELDDETAAALILHWRRGGTIEGTDGRVKSSGMMACRPLWNPAWIYRAVSAKPSIDWSHVRAEFNWLASDEEGARLYSRKPSFIELDVWESVNGGKVADANAFASYTPGTCDWRDSLICRPGAEGEE